MAEYLYSGDREKAVLALSDYPYFILNQTMQSNFSDYKAELLEIQMDYLTYKNGAEFIPEGTAGDYVPSDVKFKIVKTLIDKEARFMFSQMPDVRVMSDEVEEAEAIKQYQVLLDKVLLQNNFAKILLQAAKDCFIGRRVACLVELSETKGIIVRFYTSLQFYYEHDIGEENLVRFVTFERVDRYAGAKVNNLTKQAQRLYLVKDYKKESGNVYVSERIYDGMGKLQIERVPEKKIDLADIPAVVVTNDGTLQDVGGVSEVEGLRDFESAYNRLSNSDVDSLRKGTKPVSVLVDMNPETTKGLSGSPGSVWDLHTDQTQNESHPQFGVLAPPLNHSEPLKSTLDRIRQNMFGLVDVPDISQDGLLSGITSFKALKALYYPLTVRCSEKLSTWKPALQKVMKYILTFALLERELINGLYAVSLEKDKYYDVLIDENYALLDDVNEEKEIDLQEVLSDTMSRLSYLKKWRSDDLKTDEQRQEELTQIAIEKNMFDASGTSPIVSSKLEDQSIEKMVSDSVDVVEYLDKQATQTKESLEVE